MISDSWSKAENESISQKVLGRVKPDEPLKNRIDLAQRKLGFQITKLEGISEKTAEKTRYDICKDSCSTKKTTKTAMHRHMPEKLAHVRKMKNMIGGAKLSMEQVKIRLDTVSETRRYRGNS